MKVNAHSSGLRQRRRDAAAEHLLESAEAVIARAGYDAVTMGQIAREAGCAPGTLYLYFEDKQELLAALIERHGRDFRTRLRGAMASAPDPLEKLRLATRAFLDFFVENRTYFRAVLSSDLYRRGLIPASLTKGEQEERARLQEEVLEIIREAQARGRIRRDFPPGEVAQFMRSTVIGLMDQLNWLEKLPPAGDLMEPLWAFMTGGMEARGK